TNDGNCYQVTDSMKVTIFADPEVNAGADQYLCSGDNIYLDGIITGITTSGRWETNGTGIFVPDNTDLGATYIPSPQDTVNGTVEFRLYTTNYGLCVESVDTMVATITPPPYVEAGNDTVVCGNNSDIFLDGIVSGTTTTGIWSTSGTGIFIPDDTDLGAVYKPSSLDTANGSVIIVLSSTYACLRTDTIHVTITPAPYVNAGSDQIVCVDNLDVELHGIVGGASSEGLWATTGTGYFVPDNETMDAIYMASSADSISGLVYLTLTALDIGNCLPEIDTMRLKITTVPDVNAGDDMTVCANTQAELLGTITGGSGTGIWTSTGTGTFSPSDTSLEATYLFSTADTIYGNVRLILTSTEACMEIIDSLEVTITDAPYVHTWTDEIVCDNNTDVDLNGQYTIAGGIIWSSLASGLFSPSNTDITPVYQFTQAEIQNRTATIILTTTDNGNCNPETDTLEITMTPRPQVYAGEDTIACFSYPIVPIEGFVTAGSTSGDWFTSGTGIFSPDNQTLECLYVPSSADTANGSVILTLVSTNNGSCFAEQDSMFVQWQSAPTVIAGQNQFICAFDTVVLDGNISGASTTGYWTSEGTGIFIPSATTIDAKYVPSLDDISNGEVVLFLTSTGSCASISDTLSISINPPVQAQFITDISCSNKTVQFTDASIASNDSIISWSWSFGDNDSDTIQNPFHIYDIVGFYAVNLTIITDSGCTGNYSQNISLNYLSVNFQFAGICMNDGGVSFIDSTIIENDSIIAWNWDFGDDSTDTLQNPVYQYDSAGIYNVQLNVISADNCNDTISKEVTIVDILTDFSTISYCTYDTVLSIDSTEVINDSLVSWYWQFGDGITDTVQSPEHLYPGGNDYTVTLTGITALGCADSISKNINLSSVSAEFSYLNICMNAPYVNFIDGSTMVYDSIILWSWDFGDGDTSTIQNPQYHYDEAGVYSVELIINSLTGCSDTITKALTIVNLEAGFVYEGSCNSNIIIFTDTSVVQYDTIAAWLWDFGDGDTSSAPNPQHEYAVTGDYDVSLITQSGTGCSDTIFLNVSLNFFTADFIYAGVCMNMEGVTFIDNSAALNDSITSWSWDFGDGSYDTVQNPLHHFDTIGTYPVQLVIASDSGCSDSIVKYITISSVSAAFAYNNYCLSDNGVIFSDSSEIINDSIISWYWNFGDTTTDTLQNPIHQYNVAGVYNVQLIINSLNNCSDTIYDTITIIDIAPAFSSVGHCVNEPVIFTDNTVVTNDSLISWYWDFGDSDTSTMQNPQHFFVFGNEYIVSLITQTAQGCSDTISENITVYSVSAVFSATNVCFDDDFVSFTDGSIPFNDSIVSWSWDFGDSGTALVQNPQHHYDTIGDYFVTLIILSAQNCSDTITQVVKIVDADADFGYTGSCSSALIIFTDSSTVENDNIDSWWWSFGDGEYAIIPNPQHQYAAAGNYNVTLVIHTTEGCSDTIIKNVSMNFFVADFGYSSCMSDSGITFNDLSNPENIIVSWTWSFGDGFSDTVQNPVHFYDTAGNYLVELVIVSDSGCVDTIGKYISLRLIQASFATENICLSDSGVIFTDSSEVVNDSLISWGWYFGDGNSDTIQNPVNQYSIADNYIVQLIIGSANNCLDSLIDTISVADFQALFTYSLDCNVDSVPFTNSSTVSNDSIISWFWNFGDGQTDSIQHPYHQYDTSGTYMVSLIGTTSLGCSDSVALNVPINIFRADFNYTNVCMKDSGVVFTDNSTADNDSIVSWSWDFGDGNTDSIQNPVNQYPDPDNYSVRLIINSINDCIDSIIKVVPVADIEAVFTYSGNCANDPILFTHTSTVLNDSVVAWLWDFGDGHTDTVSSPQNTYINMGEFTIILTEQTSLGCEDTAVQSITIDPSPIAGFTLSDSNPRQGLPVSVTDNSTGATSWFYDFGDQQGTSTEAEPTYTYFAPDGAYTVMQVVGNDYGCKDTARVEINLQGMAAPVLPTAFSPNNDGNNDLLKARGGPFKEYELKVFNDWGKLVFQTNDPETGWDGKYKSKDQPVGVYVYILHVILLDDQEFNLHGDVTLIR
ncbi:MAG: PKD domain-containing protein, partial [Bacteroidia bacterium]|nr:PKD domain-containing protein [Bacteroidia bacterium]